MTFNQFSFVLDCIWWRAHTLCHTHIHFRLVLHATFWYHFYCCKSWCRACFKLLLLFFVVVFYHLFFFCLVFEHEGYESLCLWNGKYVQQHTHTHTHARKCASFKMKNCYWDQWGTNCAKCLEYHFWAFCWNIFFSRKPWVISRFNSTPTNWLSTICEQKQKKLLKRGVCCIWINLSFFCILNIISGICCICMKVREWWWCFLQLLFFALVELKLSWIIFMVASLEARFFHHWPLNNLFNF